MTQADYPAFAQGLIALGLSKAGRDVDEPTIEAYWHALDDLPWSDVQAALRLLAKEGGSRFPASSVIRGMVGKARADERDPVMARARASVASGEYGCLQCLDTGWVYVAAGRMVSMDEAAERGLRHVRACPCRGHNTNYQAKEQASRVQRAHRSDSDRWGGRG